MKPDSYRERDGCWNCRHSTYEDSWQCIYGFHKDTGPDAIWWEYAEKVTECGICDEWTDAETGQKIDWSRQVG